MPRYIYRQDSSTGNINAVVVTERIPFSGTPPEATTDFQQTVLNEYRKVEERGGPWKSKYPKNLIKRVHETALERDRHQKAS